MNNSKRLICTTLFWCVTLCSSAAWANSNLDSFRDLILYGLFFGAAIALFLCIFALSSLIFLWRSAQFLSGHVSSPRGLTKRVFGYGALSCFVMVGALGVLTLGALMIYGAIEGGSAALKQGVDPAMTFDMWMFLLGILSVCVAMLHPLMLSLVLYRQRAKKGSASTAEL